MSKKQQEMMERTLPIVERYERLLEDRVDQNIGDTKKIVSNGAGPTYLEESVNVSDLLRDLREAIKEGGES